MTTFDIVKSTRRSAAIGAIGATLLLLIASACASESDHATSESLAAAVETTVSDIGTSGSDTTTTDATVTDTTTESTTGSDDPAPTEAPAAVVPEALAFTAPLVGGGTFDGAAVAGKPTVFWFWAPT